MTEQTQGSREVYLVQREWFREGVLSGLGGAAVMVERAATLREALNEIRAYAAKLDAKINGPGPRPMEYGDIDSGGRMMFPEDIGLPPTHRKEAA